MKDGVLLKSVYTDYSRDGATHTLSCAILNYLQTRFAEVSYVSTARVFVRTQWSTRGDELFVARDTGGSRFVCRGVCFQRALIGNRPEGFDT
jgi:hypothetical protein